MRLAAAPCINCTTVPLPAEPSITPLASSLASAPAISSPAPPGQAPPAVPQPGKDFDPVLICGVNACAYPPIVTAAITGKTTYPPLLRRAAAANMSVAAVAASAVIDYLALPPIDCSIYTAASAGELRASSSYASICKGLPKVTAANGCPAACRKGCGEDVRCKQACAAAFGKCVQKCCAACKKGQQRCQGPCCADWCPAQQCKPLCGVPLPDRTRSNDGSCTGPLC